jgi:hypothetical protein
MSIDSSRYEEFSKIANKANEFLHEHEYPEFEIIGINWDEDESQWVVSYYSDYSNNEFINVWVATTERGYRLAGHSFEPIEVKF